MRAAMLKTAVAVAGVVLATQAAAQVTFYEGEGLRGRAFTVDGPLSNFDGTGFNDRAASVVVDRGSWQACEHANYAGRCVLLRPGRYDSLAAMGMNSNVSSVRPVEESAYYAPAPAPIGAPPAYYQSQAPAPVAAPTYEYGPRSGEALYEVPVLSVRAVVGPPEQRCWVERQQVVEDRRGANVPGAIIGGVIGGILGHQIGSGRGRDVATIGGAVGGAALGANVGRGGQVYDRDVQRCETVSSSARPEYWDVRYEFRGIEHRVQLSSPPGQTITVNEQGEPRG